MEESKTVAVIGVREGEETGKKIARLLADHTKLYPETEYYGNHGHQVFKRLYPDGNAEPLPLEPSLKLRNHSPTGFSWGYSGSGPAQLALALLLDATSVPETAERWYQEFKSNIVAGWDFNGSWVIFRSDIISWLKLMASREPKPSMN